MFNQFKLGGRDNTKLVYHDISVVTSTIVKCNEFEFFTKFIKFQNTLSGVICQSIGRSSVPNGKDKVQTLVPLNGTDTMAEKIRSCLIQVLLDGSVDFPSIQAQNWC